MGTRQVADSEREKEEGSLFQDSSSYFMVLEVCGYMTYSKIQIFLKHLIKTPGEMYFLIIENIPDILIVLILVVEFQSQFYSFSVSQKVKLKLCILLVHAEVKHGLGETTQKKTYQDSFLSLQKFRVLAYI